MGGLMVWKLCLQSYPVPGSYGTLPVHSHAFHLLWFVLLWCYNMSQSVCKMAENYCIFSPHFTFSLNICSQSLYFHFKPFHLKLLLKMAIRTALFLLSPYFYRYHQLKPGYILCCDHCCSAERNKGTICWDKTCIAINQWFLTFPLPRPT